MAALAHHVPGKWLGHAVLSVTFRHPSVLAKSATVMDHATGGRFILGLGAGWFDPEHTPFGIPFPPMPERFDRFESAVHTIRALFSGRGDHVRRRDPGRPVLPARRRDQRSAAADARRPADLARRPEAARHRARGGGRRRLAAAGRHRRQEPDRHDVLRRSARRDPGRARRRSGATRPAFAMVAQVPAGTTAESRREGLDAAQEAVRLRRDATSSSACRPRLGAAGVDEVARDDRRAAARGDRMTIAVRSRGRRRPDLETIAAHRQRRSARRSRHRSRRCAGRTRPTRPARGCSPSSMASPVGASAVGRIYMYPPEFDGYWGTIDVLPGRAAPGRRRAPCSSPSPTSLATAGKSQLHIPAHREPARTGSPSSSTAASPSSNGAKAVRLDAGRPRAARSPRPPDGVAHHDPGRAARSRAGRPRRRRSRPSPTSPAGRADGAPATWPSSGPATSIDRRSRRGASAIAVDADDRVVGYASLILVPGRRPVAWHDMTAVQPGVARPGPRDGPQGGDDRRGDRARPDRARDRQRRRQRADAGRQRPPRLPAAAGSAHDAGSARPRHHGAVTELEPTPSTRARREPPAALPPDPAAYDAARNVPRPRARPATRRTSPAATDPDPGAGLREERLLRQAAARHGRSRSSLAGSSSASSSRSSVGAA